MQNELKVTEEALLPVYDKLTEIEEQIKDQKGKIQTAKAQIIKNDSTIKDLLLSVVATKWSWFPSICKHPTFIFKIYPKKMCPLPINKL